MNFKKQARQGECLFVRIDAIPETARMVDPTNGSIIVGHSETGHHHVIDVKDRPDAARMLIDSTNEFISYLDVKEPCEVKHLRSFDTHGSVMLGKGKYQVRHRREYTPEGLRRVMD